jgi:hypothetical protein
MTDPIQSFEKHYAYIIEQKKKGQDSKLPIFNTKLLMD